MRARTFATGLAVLSMAALPLASDAASKSAAGAAATSPASALPSPGRMVDNVVLTDHSGAKVRWGTLRGKPRAVFFGFTRCPVICPVTLWEMENALAQIGPDADAIEVDFVSLDPARDTPEVLKSYLGSFKARVRGFTGSEKEIARLANGFDVVQRKVPTSADDYTMDHTAAVFLLDSKGKVVDVIGFGTAQDTIVARVKALAALK